MNAEEHHKRGEDQRLEVLIDAVGDPDPADRAAMCELYRAVQHMAELTASGIMTMPRLVERLKRLGPQRTEQDPALSGGAQRVLYQLDVRYEWTGGLVEAYVDDERVAWVPVVTLRRPRG